jgi:hypothetical protein
MTTISVVVDMCSPPWCIRPTHDLLQKRIKVGRKPGLRSFVQLSFQHIGEEDASVQVERSVRKGAPWQFLRGQSPDNRKRMAVMHTLLISLCVDFVRVIAGLSNTIHFETGCYMRSTHALAPDRSQDLASGPSIASGSAKRRRN